MMPEDISAYGYLIDRVLNVILWGSIIIGGFSFLIAIYILVKFRSSANPNPLSDVPSGLKKVVYVDLIMVIFDVIILAVSTYVWIFFFVRPADAVKKDVIEKGEKYVEVRVIGRQFFWTFEYPGKDGKFGTKDDFKLANVLVVPEGYNVFLYMTAGDVLHSFFIPNARLKYDTIPGRRTHIWFKPMKRGEYEIACAELCGAYHYAMKGILKILPEENYKKWLEEAPFLGK